MIIIVDGYNVLKHLSKGAPVGSRDRDQFIAQLGRYAKRKQHNIKLIFDGGSHGLPSAETDRGVRVIYAGASETADDYIARLLREQKDKDLLLVSTDRGLGDRAKRLQVPTLDAADFCEFMCVALAGNGVAEDAPICDVVRTAPGSDPTLDMLMDEATQDLQMKADDQNGLFSEERKSSPYTASKKERQLQQLLKKL